MNCVADTMRQAGMRAGKHVVDEARRRVCKMRVSDRATAPGLRLQAQQAVYPTLSTFFILDDGYVSLQQGNEISPCLQTNAILGATRLRCDVDAHVVILGCTLGKETIN